MTASAGVLDGAALRAMVAAAAAAIDMNAGALSRLDAVSGDGDHGANAQRAMHRAQALIAQDDPTSPAAVLRSVATACAEAMAGASGAVFSAFFRGAAATLGDRAADPATFAEAMAAGLQRVQTIGGARVGDKTVVDALAPAVAAAEAASARGAGIETLLADMASASRAGADASRDLTAKLGRARYAASGGLGSADAGATTMALIFESWAGAMPVSGPTSEPGRHNIDPPAASPAPADRTTGGRQ